MNKFLIIFLSLFCLSLSLKAEQFGEPKSLIIQNSILATVNGQSISVMDVVKKMDVFLDKHFPEALNSKASRYQFYTTNWRVVLSQMIDTELMIASAKEKEIQITDSEVRKVIQERFGPNIMVNLDRIGISYEEAKKMIASELIVQKMSWFKINSKALQSVNPQQIKAAYEQYYNENPPQTNWQYVVISVHDTDEENGKKVADFIHTSLCSNKCSAESVENYLSENKEVNLTSTKINISKEYNSSDKELSPSYRDILSTMEEGLFSTPTVQKSRNNGQPVYRIFCLKKRSDTAPKKFLELANQLEQKLLNDASEKESKIYSTKLRKRFGYERKDLEDAIPKEFNPFILK